MLPPSSVLMLEAERSLVDIYQISLRHILDDSFSHSRENTISETFNSDFRSLTNVEPSVHGSAQKESRDT
jgi:hypothetical protein